MVATEQCAWMRPPSSLTEVCAIVDPTTEIFVAPALSNRFADTAQFALLSLKDIESLRREWVASVSSNGGRGIHDMTEIEQVLSQLPAQCRLALCTQTVRSLDWIGSVCGHPCRMILSPDSLPDVTCQIEEATRTVQTALCEAVSRRWRDCI
ncbi:hypothetical protein CJU94_24740 [Paraburkholderia aromaticivorans]|uniref:Uncharacterized protein n=1 Tax=Paraburkholderia aromaticivorans TaxID=2026199 RepID=A0A248VSR9_9BURK|nr:hypothetical protein CJU94_24740 [Paraburkholderia aromaticivorans]